MVGTIPRVDERYVVQDYIPGQPIPAWIRDPSSGRLYTNPLKQFVKPFTLVTDPPAITLAGNAQSDPIPMVLDNKGHFEILRAFFSSTQSEGFTVLLFEPDNRQLLMNREVHVATIASGGGVTTDTDGALPTTGSAGRPFTWPETLWLSVGTHGKAIFAQFRNLSASTNTIRFNLEGLRWYFAYAPGKVLDRMEQIYRRRFRTCPFFYTTEKFIKLLGLSVGDFNVRLSDEAWHEWTKSMRVSDARFNVRIRERSTDKRLMESAIRDDLVFGNGEFPFLNWESALFEPNYQINFELDNAFSSNTNTIWITLGVRKIFIDPKEDRLARV